MEHDFVFAAMVVFFKDAIFTFCNVSTRGLKLEVTNGPHEIQSKVSRAALKNVLNFEFEINFFEI